jgi:hypothetical protein
MSPTELRFATKSDDGELQLVGYPNGDGFLGRFVAEVKEAHLGEAELIATRALMVTLSYYSTKFDVPVNIYQVQTTEVRTGTKRVSFVGPTINAPLVSGPELNFGKEFRVYASLYREGLNSNSPSYQFLCFFKIIESILERRNRMALEAKALGESFSRPRDVVPTKASEQRSWLKEVFPPQYSWDTAELSFIFPGESLGKKVSSIIQQELRPIRIDIAHTLDWKSGELMSPVDDPIHMERIYRWLPLTKYIVRRLLRTEFPNEFLI